MKVSTVLFTVFFIAISLLPATSWAQTRSETLTISPMIGGIMMEGDQDFDDDVVYSLGVGYHITEALAMEAVMAYAELEAENSSNEVDLRIYRADALYHFLTDKTLVPYLAAGIGGYDLDNDTDFMANYGLGLLYYFADDIALRADLRHLIAFSSNEQENNLLYTAGLKFQFGGKEQSVVPTPLPVSIDSDGDGIDDDLDQCPDTPAGTAVDAKGCALDSDGDGVIDRLDQCPDTPAGTAVDASGCPLDSDGDGVIDRLDQCPDTPKGVIVDDTGCELKLTLRINFDTDEAVIKPEFKSDIDRAAEFVRQNSEAPYIFIAGHTDNIGDPDYNLKLSEMRAEAVRQALIDDHGIDPDRLKTRGYGESQPIVDNATADGRYRNRRVELICCAVLPE